MHEVSDERYEVSELDIERFSAQRLWVFDLEATGLDTTRERVTQIAGLPVEGGRALEDESFSMLVYPGDGVEISQEVQELTGITPDALEGQPPLPGVWAEHLKAAAGCDLWIGQSVFEFDVPLLETEFARHGMPDELPPVFDTVVLATALLGEPENRWSTSALLERFKVTIEGLRRHDALDDVKILARILAPMTDIIRRDHGDHVRLPPGERLSVKRHPPVRTTPNAAG
jgi:DNA polymerase III epsilon subunit-like protein